ncbi:MAG: peptide ABC transporter substrate-binding protein [Chloroflexi bacterium]|nr:peptide ABC transporter substrate-binding protein [Chloroflexota bacterium]
MLRYLHAAVLVLAAGILSAGCAPRPAAPRAPVAVAPTSTPLRAPATTPTPSLTSTPSPRASGAPAPATHNATATPTPTIPPGMAGACGMLRLSYGRPPTTLNSHLALGVQDIDAARLVLEPLAAYSPRGEAIPVLAAEIPTIANSGVTTDFLTVTWKLKTGVVWSDGSDFTADDVLFTYRYVSDPQTGAVDRTAFDNILTISAPDRYTVRIRWREASQQPLEGFTGTSGQILQRRQFERFSGGNSRGGPNLAPVGTGPYIVREARAGDRIVYAVNPLYRERARGKPCFGEVELEGAPDPVTAARAALVTGQADYASVLPVDSAMLDKLAAVADARGILITRPGAGVERLLFNRTNPDPALGDYRSELTERGGAAHPFLSDLRVRRAMAMVIDRTALVAQVYGHAATPTCLALNGVAALVTAMAACPPVTDTTFLSATTLLADAGWYAGSDGVRHKIVRGQDIRMQVLFQTSANPLRERAAAYIKAAWERIGIDTRIRAVPAAVFFANPEFNASAAGRFYADVQMLGGGPDSPDPASFLKTWTCAEIRTRLQYWSGNNYERACTREYDRLFGHLVREGEPGWRAVLASQLQEILLSDLFWSPLFVRNTVAAQSRTLGGVDLNGVWDSELWNVADWRRLN